ncbi:hypothetical protein [Lysobacter gummosus]|uniref:hypothetical protein n=1 Tax=Lysobacter gummosus TaxID=262324 RepID=UPI00362D9608
MNTVTSLIHGRALLRSLLVVALVTAGPAFSAEQSAPGNPSPNRPARWTPPANCNGW